jgi:hypothetical protein
MSMALGRLRKLNTQLNALDERNHARDRLETIQVTAATNGTFGCVVKFDEHNSFLTHWYNDADQMRACLIHMKGLIRANCTERDLFDFAGSILDQPVPSNKTVIWLYFRNLTKLFPDIQKLKSSVFLKLLFAGIKCVYAKSTDTVEEGTPLVVYNHFEVDIIPVTDTTTGYDAMIYFGLKGRSKGIEYIECNGTTSPILLYNFGQDGYVHEPIWIFTPAWRRRGRRLQWTEPTRLHRDLFISKDLFRNTLSLFAPNTPYAAIGETFHMHTQLYPKTTSDHELNIRHDGGMQKVFIFETNPLKHAIDSANFVCAFTTLGFRHWQYTPTKTMANMECFVTLNYRETDWQPQPLRPRHIYLMDRGQAFDFSLTVSYKGVVTSDDFIIIRSTKTEKQFSDADSEAEAD